MHTAASKHTMCLTTWYTNRQIKIAQQCRLSECDERPVKDPRSSPWIESRAKIINKRPCILAPENSDVYVNFKDEANPRVIDISRKTQEIYDVSRNCRRWAYDNRTSNASAYHALTTEKSSPRNASHRMLLEAFGFRLYDAYTDIRGSVVTTTSPLAHKTWLSSAKGKVRHQHPGGES